jgi:ribosomal protein S18 acetylase RimI-like enzyme
MEIRRAGPADRYDCAGLILESAHDFLPAVFGQRIQRALEALSVRPRNLFSFAHAWVAAEDGKTRGMLLGYTGEEKAAEDPRTGFFLLQFLGLAMIVRLPALLSVQRAIGGIERRAYYVSNVAVYPESRGRGIGAALLARAEEEARGKRCRAMALDVETGNEGAISLYSRLGYGSRAPGRKIALGGHVFSFDRMEKPLA